jgi:hypothetical protein
MMDLLASLENSGFGTWLRESPSIFFLILANLNAVYFEVAYRKQIESKDHDAHLPSAFKAIACVSIVSWFFVIYWGRMLPFIGNAF